MKILTQLVSSLIGEVLVGFIGLIVGLSASAGSYDFSIGEAVGWEGGGVYFGIIGICFGGLVGILLANHFLKVSVKVLYLIVLTLVLILLWLSAYSSLGTMPILVILFSTGVLLTLTNNLSFVQQKNKII